MFMMMMRLYLYPSLGLVRFTYLYIDAIFHVLTTVLVKIKVVWDETLCHPGNIYRGSGRGCCLHRHGIAV